MNQAGGPEPVIRFFIPLIAERALRQRGGGSGGERRDAGVAPEARLAERGGYGNGARAGIHFEDRAGQSVFRPTAVRWWAEARVAPRAGPYRGISRVDDCVRVGFFIADEG